MKVSFRHANPQSGNESFLLRFEEESYDSQYTPCLLVDSGTDVDVGDILNEDEYLLGVLLTHAHADHYKTLPDNIQDGADVFTSADTAAVLETVLADEAQNRRNTVLNALESVSDWTKIHHSIRIYPIPAGHTPGASGFLIQFQSGEEWQTILATGDFTVNPVGGYQEFTTNIPIPIDALFLTGTTSEPSTESTPLESTVELACAGSQVVLATTGLSAVTQAYRLGHLADELGLQYSVRIMGRAAKLYNNLEYDVPNVTAVPTFESVSEHVSEGTITIAGPQTPNEGASKRFYEYIRDKPNAALVQITDGAGEQLTGGNCTTIYAEQRAHPPEDEVDRIVEQLDPKEVIITHQSGSRVRRYRDKYSSYVWAAAQSQWYLLYDEQWLAPPWMTNHGKSYVSSTTNGITIQNITDSVSLPTPGRGDVDLAAEGLDMEQFKKTSQLSVSSTNTSSGSAPESLERPSASGDTASTVTSTGETATSSTTPADASTGPAVMAQPDSAPPTRAESEQIETTGRVVDAGDGVTLLRLPTDVDLDDIQHGDELNVTLEPASE